MRAIDPHSYAGILLAYKSWAMLPMTTTSTAPQRSVLRTPAHFYSGLFSERVDHVDTVAARHAIDVAGITQRAKVDAPLTVLFIGQILAPC